MQLLQKTQENKLDGFEVFLFRIVSSPSLIMTEPF
jgi:hypothetical protein